MLCYIFFISTYYESVIIILKEAIKMNNDFQIPKSNEEVTVHLTVKELLSLSGDKFNQDHSTLILARKKLRQQIEQHQQ